MAAAALAAVTAKRGQALLCLEHQQVTFNRTGAYWLDTAKFVRNIALARQMNEANPDLAAAVLGNHHPSTLARAADFICQARLQQP